jgi:hypothetical protein
MSIEEHTIFAWVGEDELGSGRIGIKQALVPAGYIPLAAMDYDVHKLTRPEMRAALETQATLYGKKIRLVRFRFDRIVDQTEHGDG